MIPLPADDRPGRSGRISASALRPLLIWTGLAAVILQLIGPALEQVLQAPGARDFASYYYAARLALSGQNPYQPGLLDALAQAEHTRQWVYPFFYPPPFVLFSLPFAAFDLSTAYRVWFALDCLLLAVVLRALWRLVGSAEERAASRAAAGTFEAGSRHVLAPALALIAATLSPLYYCLWLGQANLPVLLLVLLGLCAVLERRDLAGGALLGAAAMLKMSPALLVLWFTLRGRWRVAVAAALAGLLLSLLALPVVGPRDQLYFYTTVLPGFTSTYHGLNIPINVFTNHSLPGLFNALFPGSSPQALSPLARGLSSLLELLLLIGLWTLNRRRPPGDRLEELLEASLLVLLMVVFPVFAYEHHLVFLLLPLTSLVWAVAGGRVPVRWFPWLGLAYAVLIFAPADLKPILTRLSTLGTPGTMAGFLAREAKLFAMCLLGAALVRARLDPTRRRPHPPAPASASPAVA